MIPLLLSPLYIPAEVIILYVSRYLEGECGRMINVASILSLTGLIKGVFVVYMVYSFLER